MAMLLPLLADEKSRNSMFSIIKYLLLFGGLGISILLFIFFGTKFDLFKGVQNWLKGAGEKITGGFKNLFKQTGDTLTKAGKQIVNPIISTKETMVKGIEEKRRDLRQGSIEMARRIEPIVKNETISKDIRERASAVKTGLVAIAKKPSVNVAQKFETKVTRTIEKIKPKSLETIKKTIPQSKPLEIFKKATRNKSKKKKGWF